MIEIKNVSKRYGKKEVLKDVSFNVKKGEITCLIGINGVGKTTIMNDIAKLTPINKGSILIDGEKISKHTYNQLSFIPDAITMLPEMTLEEAMQFMKDYYPVWNQKRAKDLLK